MELRAWKALLLQWVKKCEFIDDIEHLEDSDIEEFFASYAQYTQVEKSTSSSANRSYSLGQLQAFINDIYPNFEMHLGSDGRLMPEDYVYIYTLLMHYTCVQSPSEYFHNICKHLPNNTQQGIASFFEQTVKNPEMNRKRLHEAILSINDTIDSESHCFASPAPVGPGSSGIKKDSANIEKIPASRTNSEIPAQREVPSLLNDSQCQAPSTPKTQLLEQRTRELLGLRAQLETERYEKTVLEEQISENEHLINSLTKENKVKKMQLAKLEATLENENQEDNYKMIYVPNAFDNLKRQLLKEINKKDALLAESKEEMQELKNKHDKITLKLKDSEKQVVICMDQINDLELRLDNVTQVLTDKTEEIASLQRDKLELQQCLQEARAELHSGREVLNASSDLLETSQSAGSMNTTPESLACSVIDKQLREKEQENIDLREQLEVITNEKKEMMQKLLTILQPDQDKMPYVPDDSQVLSLVGSHLNQLSIRYEQEQERVKELQVQYSTLQQQCEENEARIREQLQISEAKLEQKFKSNELQLKCFIDTISAQIDHESNSYSLDQFENILTQWLDSMREKLKSTESDMLVQAEQLNTASLITLEIICAINPHIDESINMVSTEALPIKLKFLLKQILQLVAKYEQLNYECNAMRNDFERTVEKLKQDHEMVQSKHDKSTLKMMKKVDELQLQCNKLVAQLQQKTEEYEEVTQKLKAHKVLTNTVGVNCSDSDFNVPHGEAKSPLVFNQVNVEEHNSTDENPNKYKMNDEIDYTSLVEQELGSQTESESSHNTNQSQNELVQQLNIQLIELQLEKTYIEQELLAATEKEQRLQQDLKDQMELVQIGESSTQLLQEQNEKQVQQLIKANHDINYIQEKLGSFQKQLEQTLQQLQTERDLLKMEKCKNAGLEHEKMQYLEQNRIIEKQLEASQLLSAKREEEVNQIKEQLNTSTKRLEKMAIKLGEQQALVSKAQREMTHAKAKQTEHSDLISALQHEKENLQLELRKYKERAQRSEEKQASLEHQRSLIETERTAIQKQLQHFEKEIKKSHTALREIEHETKVIEKEKVELVLEVGGLNSKIVQLQKQTVELNAQLQDSQEKVRILMEEKEKYISRAEEVQIIERNNMVKLNSVEETLTETQKELNEVQHKYDSIKIELMEKVKELEGERIRAKECETALSKEVKSCNEKILHMRNSYETLVEKMEKETQNSKELSDAWEQLKLQTAKAQQHELDCQILQAKYREAKEEIGRCEQRLKDQRIEMEGKLEKMKTKMRTLYTSEVTRMKEKQEREMSNNKAELEKLNAQVVKYEEHTRKLSNQLVRLNEKLLEEQKKNAILSTKLQHFQEIEHAPSAASGSGDGWQPFKRPCAPAANLGSNLAMEDEEGEVFNNTYLTDLKLGTVPNMTAEELQYRNSLQPPHLKSAYAAQYNLGAQEDDIKDGPLSLDDSMSALLSTTEGNGVGTRKKSMGTHYKRPGPPTPSKHGGRLSFGGSEPPREILRETCENNGITKTPARFKIFTSRFSIGSTGTGGGGHCLPRDENSPPKRRLSNMFKRK